MYGLYSRAASNQERSMMARVRYDILVDLLVLVTLTSLSAVRRTVDSLVIKEGK